MVGAGSAGSIYLTVAAEVPLAQSTPVGGGDEDVIVERCRRSTGAQEALWAEGRLSRCRCC